VNDFGFLTLHTVQIDVGRSRQTLHDPSCITNHPPSTTDPFSLYVKGTILLSWIKSFALRFRSKNPPYIDPRETTDFKVLDSLCSSFRLSFPKEFRDPLRTQDAFGSATSLTLDPILLSAHFTAHLYVALFCASGKYDLTMITNTQSCHQPSPPSHGLQLRPLPVL
jgi:hypothetical protein